MSGLATVLLIITASNYVNAQGCMEATSDEGVSVVGYIQPEFEYWQTADGSWTNSFNFNRARIGFIGTIPYDVSYYVMVDFSKFKPEATYILDAFVSYTRFEWAKLSIGQFKSPLSLEQNTSCAGLHTVHRSKVVEELAGPQRDLGVMLFGGTAESKFKYYLAVMNDYARGFEDENTAKSIKSRFTFAPFNFLQLGGSFGYGVTGANSDNTKTRVGGEMQLSFGNFMIQGEYLWGDDTGDYTTGGGCDGTPIEFHTGGVTRDGFFAQAMYMTSWGIQPVVKFEAYDSDKSIADNTEYIQTYGLNYFLNDWTRIQLNYRYRAEMGAEVPNDQLILQVQVKF